MYPISLSHLKGPFVHGQTFTLQLDEAGDVYLIYLFIFIFNISFLISNIIIYEYTGIVQDSFKMCVNNSTTTTTFNNVEISFELIDEGHPTVNIEPLGRNYVREKKLLPNITQELPLSITVLKTAVFRGIYIIYIYLIINYLKLLINILDYIYIKILWRLWLHYFMKEYQFKKNHTMAVLCKNLIYQKQGLIFYYLYHHHLTNLKLIFIEH